VTRASVVLPLAVRVDVAPGAGIDALLVAAGERVVTVGVDQALVGPALHLGIASVSRRAEAVGSMAHGLANGVDSTSLKQARVLTLAINTRLIVSALEVVLASS